MKDLFLRLRSKISYLLSLNEDAAPEREVIAGIEAGVEFRGAKLWILVLAIFVASLGLNTNSAAVIIGAMLISPIMGPIIGMGLGMGIYDFELFKRSLRNYIVATVFSVVTATFYFLITPYSEVQSELLARTSPTIYDVLIALCGGLAGIIALGSKSQRGGNVIPGVAIATALMPPLCTVGFGLATANWSYALGALYLFVINTIFISAATFVGAKWIMRFSAKQHMDRLQEKRVRIWITTLIILTIIPSVFLTVNMVRESYFNQCVSRFVQSELHWPNTHVISHKANFSDNSVSVVLIGAEVDSLAIVAATDKMQYYGLEGARLDVMQANYGINEEDVENILRENNQEISKSEALLAQKQLEIQELQRRIDEFAALTPLSEAVYSEVRLLFPQVSSLSLSRGHRLAEPAKNDSVRTTRHYDEVFVSVGISSRLRPEERKRMEDWLRQRLSINALYIDICER